MAVTLTFFEDFAYTAPFDAAADLVTPGAPRSLQTVNANIPIRPIGPRKASGGMAAPGSSGMVEFNHWQWDIANAPSVSNLFWVYQAWFHVKSFTASGCKLVYSPPHFELIIADGKLAYVTPDGTIDTGWTVPLDRWFELSVDVRIRSYAAYPVFDADIRIHYRYVGDSAFTEIVSVQPSYEAGSGSVYVRAGVFGDGGNGGRARIGCPRLWTGDATDANTVGDAPVDTAILPPVEESHFWYVAAGGDDDADGLTPETAWATLGKANDEMIHPGILGKGLDMSAVEAARVAYDATKGQDVRDTTRNAFIAAFQAAHNNGGGDRLLIDGTGLDTEAEYLNVVTNGLTVDLQEATLDCRQTLVNASWSLSAGKTNVYEYTMTGGDGFAAVLWRDGKWLERMDLLDHANEAALLTAMDSEAEPTFYTDEAGEVIYYVGSNPITDRAVYTRSYRRGETLRLSAINVQADSVRVTNGTIVGTSRATAAGADPGVDYAVQIGPDGATGYHLLDRLTYDKTSKHAEGLTSNADACTVMRLDCVAGPGTAYSDTYSAYVDFRDGGTGTTRAYYFRCDTDGHRGVPGSTGGSAAGAAYYSHVGMSAGGGIAVDFWQCDFGDGNLATEGILVGKTHVHDCTLGYFATDDSDGIELRRCRVNLAGIGAPDNVVAYNSILIFTGANSSGGYRTAAGSVEIYGCTLDFTTAAVEQGAWLDAGDVDLTCKGNLLLFGPQLNGWIRAAEAEDTFNFDWNVYAGEVENIKPLLSYNDGSTTADRAFQYDGQDASSLRVDDAEVDGETYVPGAGSVVIGMIPGGSVAELAGTKSYNDRTRTGAMSAGAVELGGGGGGGTRRPLISGGSASFGKQLIRACR